MATEDGRYVATNGGIKEAVAGREMEILHAIGIDCVHDQKRQCPYHDHGGENDWSWDDSKKLAICTCIGKRAVEKGRRAHDIFRVVQVLESRDFESVKVRIAEILGRTDLIKIKRGSSYQKQDAESLLSAPDENRNDVLPAIYLASRLGTADVPKPTTRVIGIRSLGYFDPPSDGGKKFIYVADTPCAVFEAIDRDGRIHAMRIYLSPDGTAKADLGNGRDPKKSAVKLNKDENVSGVAVLWGNPDTATIVFICEGIETGCAVAYAFSREIAEGKYLVAACISDTGVAAFRPWPATKAVIVAADRDEGINEHGKERNRAGEKAARDFCGRHIGSEIKTGIALPGEPGEKVDWLDVLRRDGVAAVRRGVLDDAKQFVPDDAEQQRHSEITQQQDELATIRKLYPLPSLDDELFYKANRTGEFWAHKAVKKRTGIEILPLISPFTVKFRLRRHGARRDAYSLRLAFRNRDGKPGEVDIECGALATNGGRNVMAELLDAGIRTDNGGDRELIQALKAFNPNAEVLVVQQSGWYFDIGDDPIFVAPCGTVIGAPDGVQIELDSSVRLRPHVAKGGTLEGWQSAVWYAVTAKEVPHWTLGVCAIFAGVLLSLTGLDTCGVNLSGHTSGGKTTAQEIAASGWSTPDTHRDGSLLQRARSTENAIELLARHANGTILDIDELRLVVGRVLAGWIYTLAGGSGKKRMSDNYRTLQETINWSVFVLMSCEHNLATKIASDGTEYDPGISVRIVDIDVDGFDRSSVNRNSIDQMKSELRRNFGHAGAAFVRKLVEYGYHRRASELRQSILDTATAIAGAGADTALQRAAIPFALLTIAGELAKGFSVISVETDAPAAMKKLWDNFSQSAEAEALKPEDLMLQNLGTTIAQRWDVTIKYVGAENGVNNRDAWGWYDEGVVYIPKKEIQTACHNAMKERQIGKALKRMGLLAAHDDNRTYLRYVPKIGYTEAYALKREKFGRTGHDRDINSITDPIPNTSAKYRDANFSLKQLAEAKRLTLCRQKIRDGAPDRLWAAVDTGAQVTISEAAYAALAALGAPERLVTWPPAANEATGND